MLHDAINQAAYMAHGYCLLWKPWLVALHAGSDFLIFLSYFAIPIAFTGPGGNIEITWHVEGRGDSEVFRLAWRERNESLLLAQENKAGFGHTVLNRVVPDSLLGVVDYRMSEEGVSWEIEAPLREVAPLSGGLRELSL